MTNTHSTTIRTASGLLAGLTVAAAIGLLAAPGSASADADPHRVVDAADYVLWRNSDSLDDGGADLLLGYAVRDW